MKTKFVFILIFFISVNLYPQEPAKTNKDTTTHREKRPPLRRQINNENEKHNYFDVNIGLGLDQNDYPMVSIGISYKYKYNFIGLGGNVDLYLMKNSFLKDDVSNMEIPHGDYTPSNYENSNGYSFDAFGNLSFKSINLNVGYTITIINQSNFYVSNVTGWKWKGDSRSYSYYGVLLQLQYYASKGYTMGFTMTGEIRLLREIIIGSIKLGVYF